MAMPLPKPLSIDEFLDWDGDMEIVLIDQQELYCEVHRRLETIGFDQPLEALYAGVGLEEQVLPEAVPERHPS